MTIYLILDENVIILSAKAENDNGQDDIACTQLLMKILENRDCIRCNNELLGNYFEQLEQIKRTNPSTAYTVKLLNLLRTSGLISIWTGATSPVINESKLPTDDIYIVRLATNSHTNLVSTDLRLETKMNEADVMNNYDIKFLKPTEVYPTPRGRR